MFTGAHQLAVLDATAQADLVRAGEVTAVELVEAAIDRIDALNPTLNAVISTTYDEALARAAAGPTGRFAGVPYLLKDLVVERAGTPFTEGSRSLAGNVSTVTSELAIRLERAGLIILGRTNTPEFGMAPGLRAAAVRPDPQPVVDRPFDQRVERRLRRSRRVRHGADGARQRRGRLDPLPRVGLRPVRSQTDPGSGAARTAVRRRRERHGRRACAHPHCPRQRRCCSTLTAGPGIGDPYPAPPLARPLAEEIGVDPPRLRIAVSTPPGGRRAAAPGVRGCRRPGRGPAHRPRPRGDRGGPARSHGRGRRTRSAPCSTR